MKMLPRAKGKGKGIWVNTFSMSQKPLIDHVLIAAIWNQEGMKNPDNNILRCSAISKF